MQVRFGRKKLKNMRNTNEFLHLNHFENLEQISNEKVELILLPPNYMDADTNKEVENYPELTEMF